MPKFAVLILALISAACAGPMATRAPPEPVTIGIIAFNDFHGALETPQAPVATSKGQVVAGGAAHMAAAIDAIRANYDHTLTVSAGDLIGASQPVSALFLDEPTVGAMNRMGLDFNAVGNHEFDRGRDELLRMQRGGCEKHTLRTPCVVETFAGARFSFLAASTFSEDGSTILPATGMRSFGTGDGAVKIGIIGLTLRLTEYIVSREGIAGLKFGDEADAINLASAQLKREGADSVIVLIHEGGLAQDTADPNGCSGLQGAILPILDRIEPRIDVVVSGHTHQAYICEIARQDGARPILLTSAGFHGRLVTEIALTIDPQRGHVVSAKAKNRIVDHTTYQPRPDIARYVHLYSEAARDLADRPVGRLAGTARRGVHGDGGSLGNLITDAHLAATRSAGAQIAFTNPFGIRADLVPEADGSVTFGQIFTAQPFSNRLVTQTMSGADIKAALEQGVDDDGPHQLLAPSAGFSYRYDLSRAAGDRITAIRLVSKPIEPDTDYRVTVNSFLAGGKDSFHALAKGRDRTVGPTDVEALEAWLQGDTARGVPSETRVSQAP